MIDARAVIAGFIGQHEGALSLHPADNGNWYDPARFVAGLPQVRGAGRLVGSKFGVTAYAYLRYRQKQVSPGLFTPTVTLAEMDAITLDAAVTIGLYLYYREPALDRLTWNRVTASVLDKAWGSGPARAIRMLQRLIGVAQDACIGPATAAAYAAWVKHHGEDEAAHLWCQARIAFDQSLVSGPTDPDRVFVGGWNNRSRSFLPGTPWWKAAA